LLQTFGLALAGLAACLGAQDPPAKNAIPEDKDPVTTASGLKYTVLRAAETAGPHPGLGDRVHVHYTGWLEDGTEFDSSRRHGQPATFVLGRVIQGWNEGVALMSPGARYKLTVPAALGYGEAGEPRARIPGNATLIFDVELLRIDQAPAFVAPQPDKTATTASGVKYEVTAAGSGENLTDKDRVELEYGVWTRAGQSVMSHLDERAPIKVGIGDLQMQFMRELLVQLKDGGACVAEVPVATVFTRGKPPVLGDDKECIWMLKVVRVFRPLPVPAFEASPADKLVKTDSGLQYEVRRPGTGKKPEAANKVEVHYVGWLEDGTVFDSSYERGEPAEFFLHGVIPGWTEGVQLMQEGAVYQFVIPAKLAYGEAGSPPKIPANATLVFRIELLAVK
jgi:FKBP-type peptidyl-prolyl cis-trans isomerase